MTSSLVIPGQSLGPANAYIPGAGVYIHNNQIISSLVGLVQTTQYTNPPTICVRKPSTEPSQQTTTSAQDPHSKENPAILLPEVNSEVLARVTRINTRQATVSIFVVNGQICSDEFSGVIRAQDVRLTEIDKVKIFNSFRPGDIVRAKVISLGDQSNYYLSTASNNLGVVMADSESGDPMYPVSWKEMKSTRTGAAEERKVAKPF